MTGLWQHRAGVEAGDISQGELAGVGLLMEGQGGMRPELYSFVVTMIRVIAVCSLP